MSLLGKEGVAQVQRLQARLHAIEHGGDQGETEPDLPANRAMLANLLRSAGAGQK